MGVETEGGDDAMVAELVRIEENKRYSIPGGRSVSHWKVSQLTIISKRMD